MLKTVYGTPVEIHLLISLILFFPYTFLTGHPPMGAVLAALTSMAMCYLASIYGWIIVGSVPIIGMFLLLLIIYLAFYSGR